MNELNIEKRESGNIANGSKIYDKYKRIQVYSIILIV
jgi:hypothetical protein